MGQVPSWSVRKGIFLLMKSQVEVVQTLRGAVLTSLTLKSGGGGGGGGGVEKPGRASFLLMGSWKPLGMLNKW